MQAERRELELRKDGQLATLLGASLPGEPPAALRRLASEDRRQAEEELVALTSNGKTSYKHLEELSARDMPARIAASRLRTTWLKERGDGWLLAETFTYRIQNVRRALPPGPSSIPSHSPSLLVSEKTS